MSQLVQDQARSVSAPGNTCTSGHSSLVSPTPALAVMQTGGCCSLVSLAQASPPLDQALMFTDEYCGLAGMSLKIPYQAHPQSQFSHTPMGAATQPDPSPNTFPVGIQPSKDNPKEPLPDLALNTAFAYLGPVCSQPWLLCTQMGALS